MTPETHVYKKAGDLQLSADVYRSDRQETNAPVIAWFHGGGLISGSRAQTIERLLSDCLEAGYLFASFDYRLAPETKLPEIIEDVSDAVSWIRAEAHSSLSGDDARVAVAGASAGGYLALMSGLFEWKPRAIVSFYGYGDVAGQWCSRPDPYYSRRPEVTESQARATVGETPLSAGEDSRDAFYIYCRQSGAWSSEIMGRDPREEPEFFKPYCPLRNITSAYPPTILLHGDADTDVPYEQSVLMADELAHAGVRHELVTIPNGPHQFDKHPENPVVDTAFERVMAFLETHLG